MGLFQNKRVFVSGGAGVVGTALVNRLLEEGAILFVGDLKPCPQDWVGRLIYWQGDLNFISKEELSQFNPELFFHLAATFERSNETYGFFEENHHHNLVLSHHLMECLKGSALQTVVFASSYLIYDPQLYLFASPPKEPTLLKEDSPIRPRNICGAAKLYHEEELNFLGQFLEKITFISARIFRVYGKGSRDIISRWIRAGLKGETLEVYRPEGKFDYIFADDVAEGLLRLALKQKSGLFNLGSGNAREVHEVITLLKSHFPSLKTVMVDSTIPCESSQADIRHLEETTGWKPVHSLEKALPLLIEWERRQFPKQEKIEKALLVTSISKKIPLLESVRKAILKLDRFKTLFGADLQSNCLGRFFIDQFWQMPLTTELTVEQLLDYCREHAISAIIPTRDGELPFFARHKEQLKNEGISVMVSSLSAVEACLDKELFAKQLLQKGFPAIPTERTVDALQTNRYVVKERHGAGSRSIGLNLAYQEAFAQAASLKEPLFQPYIEGKEWSVDLYRTKSGLVKGCVARERNLIVDGESQITTTKAFPVLEKLCHEMAVALKLYGHAIFQILEDAKGQFHVIECNARFGGASTASLAVGLDSFYWFLLEASEVDIDPIPFIRLKDIRQIRVPHDHRF